MCRSKIQSSVTYYNLTATECLLTGKEWMRLEQDMYIYLPLHGAVGVIGGADVSIWHEMVARNEVE